MPIWLGANIFWNQANLFFHLIMNVCLFIYVFFGILVLFFYVGCWDVEGNCYSYFLLFFRYIRSSLLEGEPVKKPLNIYVGAYKEGV